MKREHFRFALLTVAIFAVLATILIANVAPARDVLLHNAALVVLAPLVWIVGAIGRLRLWPFSEKAGLPAAIFLGFLTLLVSLLYAAAFTSIVKLSKKMKRCAEPAPGHVPSKAAADGGLEVRSGAPFAIAKEGIRYGTSLHTLRV